VYSRRSTTGFARDAFYRRLVRDDSLQFFALSSSLSLICYFFGHPRSSQFFAHSSTFFWNEPLDNKRAKTKTAVQRALRFSKNQSGQLITCQHHQY
jgi:hypothetical protein